MECLDPTKVAELICEVLLPQLDEPILTEDAHHIRSYLIQNAIDSEKMESISGQTKELTQFLVSNGEIDPNDDALMTELKDAIWVLSVQLEGGIQMLKLPVQWTHIVSAVRHEMTNNIANKMESILHTLPPPNRYAGSQLVNAINSVRSPKLTLVQKEYLKALLKRAFPIETAVNDNDSYVHLLHYLNWSVSKF